jgi:hypothetical protein
MFSTEVRSWVCLTKDTNTESSNRTSGVQVRERFRTSLETASKTEDECTGKDCPSSTKLVSHRSTESSTEESTTRKHGHHGTNLIARWLELAHEGLRANDLSDNTQIVTV